MEVLEKVKRSDGLTLGSSPCYAAGCSLRQGIIFPCRSLRGLQGEQGPGVKPDRSSASLLNLIIAVNKQKIFL